MTKPAISQSQKRFQESVGALFSLNKDISCVFLKSSTDTGVIRNGGRNGARFAPQSFLSTFKKFSQDISLSELSFVDIEVSSPAEEEENFHEAQKSEASRIAAVIEANPKARICHIGGGHDHIYPLLRATSKNYSKVIVINIDAHADTRTDTEFHSGTPFRQFADEFQGEFRIYQVGLHPFANSFSTLSELKKGVTEIIWKNEITEEKLTQLFAEIQNEITDKTLVVFSLDADALTGAEVPGVSAVNPAGITRSELMKIWNQYMKLKKAHQPVLGIYELNPVYDTLASISMRTVASFVFESLR